MALVHKHMDNPNSIKLQNHDIVSVTYNKGQSFSYYRIILNKNEMKTLEDNRLFSFPKGFNPVMIRISDSEWNVTYIEDIQNSDTISSIYRNRKNQRQVNDIDILKDMCSAFNMGGEVLDIWRHRGQNGFEYIEC